MFAAYSAPIGSALLFYADKYRQVQLRTRLFNDLGMSDMAHAKEVDARRLAEDFAYDDALSTGDITTLKIALAGFVDDVNRKAQIALTQGDLQNYALLEHRCREARAALAAVGGREPLEVPAPALPSLGGPVPGATEDV